MYLSVVTFTELRMGVISMPAGKRRDHLVQFLEESLPATFAGRVLPVTASIADDCGYLLGFTRKAGLTIDPLDAMIAATARVHGFSVVTLNVKHFNHLQVPLVDPSRPVVP